MKTAEDMRNRATQQRRAQEKARTDGMVALELKWCECIDHELEVQYNDEHPANNIEVDEPANDANLVWYDLTTVAERVMAIYSNRGFCCTQRQQERVGRYIHVIKLDWAPLAGIDTASKKSLTCEGCGSQEDDVKETFCPYAADVDNNPNVPATLCGDCYQQRCDDI